MKNVRPSRRMRLGLVGLAGVAVAAPAIAGALGLSVDFGAERQKSLNSGASTLFGGIGTPLAAPATPAPVYGAKSVALASGLRAELLKTGNRGDADPANHLYDSADMIAFWPSDTNPEWAIFCIENSEKVPGVQRVKLRGKDRGTTATILTGTSGCDGIRRTPWNTILATEEEGDGWALEIYNPATTTGVTLDRAAGAITGADAANVQARPALGRFAWEGLEVFADGSVVAGDELGPNKRVNGGAIFKFVSAQKPAATPAELAALADPANAAKSPLAKGELFTLELGGHTDNRGQGNETGVGKWVGPIDPATARKEGQAKGTGFYRPEDLHADPLALAAGKYRVCWTNTGRAKQANYGSVLCMDDVVKEGVATGREPNVQPFILGNARMNQPDNLAFQPRTGIAYVIEDTPFIDHTGDGKPEDHPGEIWACLPDGADDDTLTDGCVRVLSVKTAQPGATFSAAEPTGFTFEGTGTKAYLNIQHSPDDPTTAEDESTTDDLLLISGFQPGKALKK